MTRSCHAIDRLDDPWEMSKGMQEPHNQHVEQARLLTKLVLALVWISIFDVKHFGCNLCINPRRHCVRL